MILELIASAATAAVTAVVVVFGSRYKRKPADDAVVMPTGHLHVFSARDETGTPTCACGDRYLDEVKP